MASIRLSPDVEALARQVVQAKGLDSTRTAIEAIVRCHWQDYIGGTPQAFQPASTTSTVVPIEADIDGLAALDSVM